MAEKQDIQKSVEETVAKIMSADEQAATAAVSTETEVNKSMPASPQANGGEDKIRSGSPGSEEQKTEEAKKADDKEDEDEDDKEEKDEKDAEKSKSKMKKSLEELSAHLDADELELVKTWREECEKEEIAKSQAVEQPAPAAVPQQNFEEVLKKAMAEVTADLKKAIDEKDTLIKGLSEKIEKMANQPAYDRRSISTLETIEKSGSASTELKKSQVLDKMLELQAAGKGVTSHHIAEFEATQNISDPTVRGIVFRELKVQTN